MTTLTRASGLFVRSGSCNQCEDGPIPGECCTKLALPISPTAGANPDVRVFFALHGVEVRFAGELSLAVLPLRCSALLPNGDCSLYDKPERPQVCSSGPLNAWAGKALNPHCSYVFEPAEE